MKLLTTVACVLFRCLCVVYCEIYELLVSFSVEYKFGAVVKKLKFILFVLNNDDYNITLAANPCFAKALRMAYSHV